LRDNEDAQTYFVHFPELDEDPRNDDDAISIRSERRWKNKQDIWFPMWIDSPKECLRRGLVPVRLLDPQNNETISWVEEATVHLEPGDDVTDIAQYKKLTAEATQFRDRLKLLINEKREVVKHFNLPYLRLPSSTTKETALSVFINMNTNAKPLSPYDIVVAELEGATDQRLKEMQSKLDAELPRLKKYISLDSAVLQTSALLQGKVPSQRGYFEMDYEVFADNWSKMVRGLRRAVQTMESMRIYDGERLPSAIPLPVIAALLADELEDGDRRGKVDTVMRRYAWRSFFTNRYEATAASRAAADYRGLAALLADDQSQTPIPVFDDDLFPLPDARELRSAKWPRGKNSLSRAILAASNYFGARDFADDTELSAENVVRREYHHVFPNQLLSDANIESMLALNCVLITWKTNRTIGRLDPITYLEKRAEHAPQPRDIKDRLESHLVPYEAIAAAGPYDQAAGPALREAVQPDFDKFLMQRAELISRFMESACAGHQPYQRDILDSASLETESFLS
jgi:hypothetical protein